MTSYAIDFSTLPRELQASTLDWVDMRESLRLLAVCWRLRWHVIERGAFTRALRSLDIRLDGWNASMRHDFASSPQRVTYQELLDLLYERPPIRFHFTTRHFEGEPWPCPDWRVSALVHEKSLIAMIRFCPQLRITGCCLSDGRLSYHYAMARVEDFVPINVARIGKLWLDCPLAYVAGIGRALAETRIDLAIVDASHEYNRFSVPEDEVADAELHSVSPSEAPLVERVIFAPRSAPGDRLLLRVLELWRPRQVTGIMLGRCEWPIDDNSRPPIGDWALLERWVRLVLDGDEGTARYSIRLLLPLAEHIADARIHEQFTTLFGDRVLRRHIVETYRDHEHRFAEPRAEWWLKFAPRHPPKARHDWPTPPRVSSSRKLRPHTKPGPEVVLS